MARARSASLRMRVALRSFSSVGFMSAARRARRQSEVSVGPGWVGSHRCLGVAFRRAYNESRSGLFADIG